ncbi:STAS domain-containing protein [Mycolicibacterium sp.]|uniref:STAS domain-containing protein n=1 Tax=Mycolicibacterium sp. TaxID=2320850 RepID=UPI003560F7A0
MSVTASFESDAPMVYRTVRLSHRRLDTGVVAVSAHGEIDDANADDFCDYVLELAPGCDQLVVDLSELTFFGTPGVSALRRLRTDTAWVLVTGPAVARMLRVCDAAGDLPVAGSLAAALTVLRGAPGLRLVGG